MNNIHDDDIYVHVVHVVLVVHVAHFFHINSKPQDETTLQREMVRRTLALKIRQALCRSNH